MCQIITWQIIAFSVIAPKLWNSVPQVTRNSSSQPIFCSRGSPSPPPQNCVPSLGSFPSRAWLSTSDSDSSLFSILGRYRMTPRVRLRAIALHYYSGAIIIIMRPQLEYSGNSRPYNWCQQHVKKSLKVEKRWPNQ